MRCVRRSTARGGTRDCMQLDLADAASIRSFAATFLAKHARLDVLVHDAGLILSERRESKDGIEATFATNPVGPFLLNALLLERLCESAPAHVIVVASDAYCHSRAGLDFEGLEARRSYSGVPVYALEAGQRPVCARAGAAARRYWSDRQRAASRGS